MEGPPPPARAPLGRPTVLTDLPGDVLAHILSFIPFEGLEHTRERTRVAVSRFAAAAACTALAAAARPPSAAWTDVAIPERFVADVSGENRMLEAKQNALRDAMARAAPSVRRLGFGDGDYCPLGFDPALIIAMAAPAAPFLKELELPITRNVFPSMFEPTIVAATRLTRLKINKFCFEGPRPMIAAGRAAIIAFRNDVRFDQDGPSANYFDALPALLRSLSAAAPPGVETEPPVLVRLEPLWLTQRVHLEQAAFVSEFTSVFGRHLTRLAVRCGKNENRHVLSDPETHAEARTAVTRLLENRALPALRELVIDWRQWSGRGVPLDLAGVRAPPPGLTSLSVRAENKTDVLVSPAIRAGLASLAVEFESSGITAWPEVDPPQCLRGTGGSFGRLTRLVYGSSDQLGRVMNLAPWGRPEFSIPTLVEMEAIGGGVTLSELGRGARRSWCEGFLASLPRLARLVLWDVSYGWLFRASATGSMDAAAVEDVVTTRLPQAACESGRRLDVAVHPVRGFHRVSFGWGVHSRLYNGFELALEARPAG
jgi:hypothetical protein